MTDIRWSTERRKIRDLIPWPRNPRQIKGEQVRRLQESVEEFGQFETVAIGPANEVYNGHQRLKSWGAKFGPDYEVEVRVSSRALSEKEREKLTILAHKGATGEWDFDTLANEFEFDDLIKWGFTEKELGFGPEPKGEDAGAQVDKAEELRVKWGVESGQLWKLGEHRIICGDCTDRAVVERVKDIPLNIMVTDPPYGVEYDADWRNKVFGEGDRAIGEVVNDDNVDWREAWQLFDGDIVYCWHAGQHASKVENSLLFCGFETKAQIIWSKKHFVISRGHYSARHEPCWYSVRKGKSASWIGADNEQTVWEFGLDDRAIGGHSTQKPIECMERPIRNHNGDVYDPFLGSGTTLIACERISRKCRAVEISPAYVAVAIQRWVDMTGGTPELLCNEVTTP